VRLESNVATRILMVSENWITESYNLTEERLDIVFKRCDVPKRMASDLVGFSAMPFSHAMPCFNNIQKDIVVQLSISFHRSAYGGTISFLTAYANIID